MTSVQDNPISKFFKVNEMKKYALQQQIIAQRRKYMDSINQNTTIPNIHPQLQSNLQMSLATSVQNGVPTSQVNGAPKKLFQPPPPTSVTEPPSDIEIDTESKKSLLEVNYNSGLSLDNPFILDNNNRKRFENNLPVS